MEYVPVSSASIDSVGFDPESQTLGVVFRNGSEYHYYNVPHGIFEGLCAASSVGSYLDVYVKKAGYAFARVR